MSGSRVRLGVSIEIQEGMSYADTLAMARAAEDLGFEAALLAEHYYPSGRADRYTDGPGSRMSADAWIYLAALARETSRIRLGTLVSPVTFRHPAVVAKMAATLDHLSAGRAELGLGAGWYAGEHAAFGFPFPPAGRRVDLLEEQLQIVSGLWREPVFSHAGRAFTLEACRFTPRPLQQPRPTLIVGGSVQAERLPRLAARYADEYVVTNPSEAECREVRRRLDTACRAAGRDPAGVRLAAFMAVCVGESPAEVSQRLDALEQTNPQYVRLLDTRATWLCGTAEEARQQLARLGEAGLERVFVCVNSDLHREMLRLLA